MIFLLTIVNEDDEKKIEILYKQYHRLMYKIAYEVLHNRGEVEDVLHDSFIKIAKHIDNVGDPYSKETRNFLGLIAKNTALDVYRKKKSRWRREVSFKEVYDSSVPRTYMRSSIDGDAQFLVEAIRNLPDMYREALSLKFTNQYSIKEISNILNISETNVKQRIFRAKKMLEEEIKRLMNEE